MGLSALRGVRPIYKRQALNLNQAHTAEFFLALLGVVLRRTRLRCSGLQVDLIRESATEKTWLHSPCASCILEEGAENFAGTEGMTVWPKEKQTASDIVVLSPTVRSGYITRNNQPSHREGGG